MAETTVGPRVRALAVSAAVVAMGLATTAVASAQGPDPRMAPVQGPVLVGADGDIAWIGGKRTGTVAVRVSDADAERTVFRSQVTRGRRLRYGGLAVDGQAMAIGLTESAGTYFSPSVLTRVYAGVTEESLRLVSGPCEGDNRTDTVFQVALAGSELAALGPGCAERSLTDLRLGTRRPLPAAALEFRRDGDYLSWQEREDLAPGTWGYAIQVMNTVTGHAYRIGAAQIPTVVFDYDIGSDGALAMTYTEQSGPRRTQPTLAWATPGRPTVVSRPLPSGMRPGTVRLTDQQALLLMSPRHRSPEQAGRLFATTLAAGAPLTTVGWGLDASGAYARVPMDIRGTRIAFSRRACGRVRLFSVPDLADPALRRHPPRRCPLQLRGRPRVEDGRLIVPISCAGYAERCQLRLIRATTVRGNRTIARRRAEASPGRTVLPLTRFGRSFVARRTGRVRFSAYLSDQGSTSDRGGRRHTTIRRLAR